MRKPKFQCRNDTQVCCREHCCRKPVESGPGNSYWLIGGLWYDFCFHLGVSAVKRRPLSTSSAAILPGILVVFCVTKKCCKDDIQPPPPEPDAEEPMKRGRNYTTAE